MLEEREKAGEGRLERNKRWRQRKEAPPPSSSASSSSSFKELEDIQEEEKLSRRREPSERRQDEKEARREKNREWRKKRSRGEEDSEQRCQRSKVLGLGSFCKKCSPAHVTRSVLLSIDIMVVFMFSNSRGLVQQIVPRVTSCVRSVQMRWLIVLLHSFNMRQIDEMPPIGLFCSWLKTLNFKCRCALCVRVRLVYSIQPCTRLPSWSTTSTMCSNQNIQKRCVRF